MEIYNKLSYDIQDFILEKIFKKTVDKNKVDLIEELEEECWIIFNDAWNKYFEEIILHIDISLQVFPYEILIHKPYNVNIIHLVLQIDNTDITNLFHIDEEEDEEEEESICNIFYSIDENITYGHIVEIINDECINYINFIKEEFDDDIRILEDSFIETIVLEKQIEKIRNLDTYKIKFTLQS